MKLIGAKAGSGVSLLMTKMALNPASPLKTAFFTEDSPFVINARIQALKKDTNAKLTKFFPGDINFGNVMKAVMYDDFNIIYVDIPLGRNDYGMLFELSRETGKGIVARMQLNNGKGDNVTFAERGPKEEITPIREFTKEEILGYYNLDLLSKLLTK